jgi:two-component system chemotaxis sensor kinase CheA
MSIDQTSVHALIKEKINEASLLLIMTAHNDSVGMDMLCELLNELAPQAESQAELTAISTSWKFVIAQRQAQDSSAFFDLVSKFVTACIALVEKSGEPQFPIASMGVSSTKSGLEGVDQTFLPEFIETHRLQLEEFESWLLNKEFKNDDGEDTEALVKRYIHSLKGDAGSIGLKDIERTCHKVEDSLSQRSVGAYSAQLLQFKEWIANTLDALINKKTPKESGADFLARFTSGTSVAPEASPSSQKQAPIVVESPQFQAASDSYLLTGERDIFQEFVAEAEEHLGNVEAHVLGAEGSYTKDAVDTIFRGIHSLKGGSAYFSFHEMSETSHLLENLLDEVRDGKRELDQGLTGLVLTYIDLQKNLLNAAKVALAGDGRITRSPLTKRFLEAQNSFVTGNAAPSTATNTSTQTAVEPTRSASNPDVSAQQAPNNESSASKGDKIEVKNFVKVDTARLDHLIDSIGEMAIYSSMLVRRCRNLLQEHEDVVAVTHRVEKFTRDLQDVGMSMRLVPIKGLFQKMSRLVWDTSKKIKKDITFSMDGEDTELDRNLIDKLADPLMHMVRNALDHGVEPPDERVAKGKSKSGKVHLSASHSGGSIVIRIEDDGRGLDPQKLLTKAREKGIIEPDQKLTEQETYQLIFAAGFSTAAVVTDISGRGVGMDVVRRNVESLRGRIHIESEVGVGTVFTIELPLTLAIIDGIEVMTGNDHFIIPSLAIVEFVRPTADMLNKVLEGGETFHFRGKYLPVFRLCDLYNIEPKYRNPLEATFIVVENNDELAAIMVDEILGELSTVIKSLGPFFSDVPGVSGCAVMPNGEVALILDVRTLLQLARRDYKIQRVNKVQNESDSQIDVH